VKVLENVLKIKKKILESLLEAEKVFEKLHFYMGM